MSSRAVPPDVAAFKRRRPGAKRSRADRAAMIAALNHSEQAERSSTSFELYQRAEMLEKRGADVDHARC